MSDLGRFLEVVFGPREAFASVQGVIRTRTDREIASRATGGGRTAIGKRRPASAQQDAESNVQTATIDFWIEPPDRFRLEERFERGERRRETTKIIDGKRWWEIKGDGRVETNSLDPRSDKRGTGPGLSDIECHFVASSLRRYFEALVLESEGPVRTAGRDCLRIRATVRPGESLWPHWLPSGADVYEFHADAERGTLLYVAGIFEGEVFESSEVERVVYDEPIDPTRFVYAPKPEDRIRPPSPISERVSLAEAVARLPFAVLLPRDRTPFDFCDLMITHDPGAEENDPSGLRLIAFAGGPTGGPKLWMKQSAGGYERDLRGCVWEEFERDGQKFALSDPGEGMRILAFARHGTHVAVISDLALEILIELALSLIPESELPRSNA